jgi:hypothetical protein
MDICCKTCGVATKIPQPYAFHAGFSNRGFLYNDSRAAIIEFSPYNLKYVAAVGDKHPWALNAEEKSKVEKALKPDPAGGKFRFDAHPRCPACNAELPDLLPDDVHFVEIGDVIDGDVDNFWF